jgi:hypothetical protein
MHLVSGSVATKRLTAKHNTKPGAIRVLYNKFFIFWQLQIAFQNGEVKNIRRTDSIEYG